MKTPTTGNIETREALEAFVIKAHAETGELARVARAAGISKQIQLKPSKHKASSLKRLMIWDGFGLVFYGRNECGRATKSTSQALITWNHRAALVASHRHPTTGRPF